MLLQALEMIRDIRNAFNELLNENDWMDEKTKAVAKQKVRRHRGDRRARVSYSRAYVPCPTTVDGLYLCQKGKPALSRS